MSPVHHEQQQHLSLTESVRSGGALLKLAIEAVKHVVCDPETAHQTHLAGYMLSLIRAAQVTACLEGTQDLMTLGCTQRQHQGKSVPRQVLGTCRGCKPKKSKQVSKYPTCTEACTNSRKLYMKTG
jgi:hypothetical protein